MVCPEVRDPFGYEDTLSVELMRSTAWLEANEVEVGGWMRLAFEELKVDDDGWVRSISSCPEIQLCRHRNVHPPQ